MEIKLLEYERQDIRVANFESGRRFVLSDTFKIIGLEDPARIA